MAVDALSLETSLVLDRPSAAVRITIHIPSLFVISSTHSHGLPFLITAAGYTCTGDSSNGCALDSTNTDTIATTPTTTFTTPKPTNTSTGGGGGGNNGNTGSGSSDSGSGDNGSNGSNGIKPTSTSSTPSPISSLPSTQANGAKDRKGSSTFFGLALFFVLISAYVL